MPWFAWIAIAGIVSYTVLELVKTYAYKDKYKDLYQRVNTLEVRANAQDSKASGNEKSPEELTK